MVQRLEVHRDDRRNAGCDLAHVVDAHDDEAALLELRAAGIDDGDARFVAHDRLLDALVPDRVSGHVEVVEHESADGREELRHLSGSVPARCPHDPQPIPVERIGDRTRVQPELAKRLLVLGLTEDRHVAWEEPFCGSVQVVAVPVGHEDRIESANDLLRGERQRHGRVRARVAGALDRGTCPGVVEHGIDHETPARQLQYAASRCGRG